MWSPLDNEETSSAIVSQCSQNGMETSEADPGSGQVNIAVNMDLVVNWVAA